MLKFSANWKKINCKAAKIFIYKIINKNIKIRHFV